MKLKFFIYSFLVLTLRLRHKALLHETQLGPEFKFRPMLRSQAKLVEGPPLPNTAEPTRGSAEGKVPPLLECESDTFI